MDPMTMQAIATGGQVGLGLLGEVFAGKSEDEQEELLRQAVDEFGNIDLPLLEQIVAEQLGPSEFSKIQTDPELKKAQMDSLRRLQEAGREGYSLEDSAAVNDAMQRSYVTERGQREGLMNDLASRGALGSGTEALLRSQNQSAAANNARQESHRAALEGRRRSLDATMQAGRLGGDIRGQDFGEASKKAEAQDYLNRVNADYRTKAAYYNKQLPQQQFNNQMNRAQGKVGAINNLAGFHGQQADSTRQLFAGMGSASSSLGQTGAAQANNDEWLKLYKQQNGGK